MLEVRGVPVMTQACRLYMSETASAALVLLCETSCASSCKSHPNEDFPRAKTTLQDPQSQSHVEGLLVMTKKELVTYCHRIKQQSGCEDVC